MTLALVPPSGAADAEDAVWCLDVARDLVTRREAEACAGRIVDAEEAGRVRARRRNRIRRNFDAVERNAPGRRMSGSGSGFFIAPDGTLVTNAHVVDDCQGISVEAAGNVSGSARLLGIDGARDLALLRADFAPPATATFGLPRVVTVDEPIAVVGFPLHGRVAIKPILVTGTVLAATRPPVGGSERFRLRADVRRGNSGGPVLDSHGLVIGVVTGKVNTPRTFQLTGRLVRDVAIAVRSETVFGFLQTHDQRHRRARPAAPLSDAEIMDRASAFVARVLCWR